MIPSRLESGYSHLCEDVSLTGLWSRERRGTRQETNGLKLLLLRSLKLFPFLQGRLVPFLELHRSDRRATPLFAGVSIEEREWTERTSANLLEPGSDGFLFQPIPFIFHPQFPVLLFVPECFELVKEGSIGRERMEDRERFGKREVRVISRSSCLRRYVVSCSTRECSQGV